MSEIVQAIWQSVQLSFLIWNTSGNLQPDTRSHTPELSSYVFQMASYGNCYLTSDIFEITPIGAIILHLMFSRWPISITIRKDGQYFERNLNIECSFLELTKLCTSMLNSEMPLPHHQTVGTLTVVSGLDSCHFWWLQLVPKSQRITYNALTDTCPKPANP